jgi:hypothetical protein
MVPSVVGLKSMAALQLAPAVRVYAVDELVLVCVQVEALSQPKFAATLGLYPVMGSGKVRVALPLLATVTVCGLSVLVEPTAVVAKVRVGGVA